MIDSPLAQAVLLGVLQGLTEFLPVSSSGHLALAQQGFPELTEPLLLDIMLHVGTLAAVVLYFRADLVRLARLCLNARGKDTGASNETEPGGRLLIALLIVQVPTAVIGLLLEDQVEFMLGSTAWVGAALLVTAVVLVSGDLIGKRVNQSEDYPSALSAVFIGVAQGISVVPGISRSGSTISVARALGVSGPVAARFSFLASLPAVAGAAAYEAYGKRAQIGDFTAEVFIAYMVVGPLVAGLVGYLAIGAVMRVVKAGGFSWFAAYLAVVGAGAIVLALI